MYNCGTAYCWYINVQIVPTTCSTDLVQISVRVLYDTCLSSKVNAILLLSPPSFSYSLTLFCTFLQDATDATTKEIRKICSEYPLFVVVRLCTSEQSVVDFYNKLDQELELPLDVLRNLEAESREIKRVKRMFWKKWLLFVQWFSYSLHDLTKRYIVQWWDTYIQSAPISSKLSFGLSHK